MSDTFNSVRTQRTNVFASQYESAKETAQKDIDAINALFAQE